MKTAVLDRLCSEFDAAEDRGHPATGVVLGRREWQNLRFDLHGFEYPLDLRTGEVGTLWGVPIVAVGVLNRFAVWTD